jgi:uncharacterized protein YxjI
MTGLATAQSTDLTTTQSLVVTQQKEWGEIIVNWETNNRYEVATSDGMPVYFAGEVGTGWLSRQFLRGKRPFTIEIKDASGGPAFKLVRPWRWWFNSATMYDAAGNELGTIQQRWAVFRRRYDLRDPSGNTIAELHGPFFRPWTFRIKVDGDEQGAIKKKWSGLLKEAFSDADNFGIEFGTGLDQQTRTIALGATFLIDFVHFEKSQ